MSHVHVFLPTSGCGSNQTTLATPHITAAQPGVSDPSGPAIPPYQRPDRHVLRASTANEGWLSVTTCVYVCVHVYRNLIPSGWKVIRTLIFLTI